MGGGGGGAGPGDYGDLETAAKDFVRKFGITAGDDLENLSTLVGVGGRRLQGSCRAIHYVSPLVLLQSCYATLSLHKGSSIVLSV